MVRPSHLGMMAAVLGLTLGPPCAAQEEGGIMKGRAFIPTPAWNGRNTWACGPTPTTGSWWSRPAAGPGEADPLQIRSFYGVTGTGSGVIAIVDAYDYATALSDFNTFAGYFGLPLESSSSVTASTNKVFQVVYATGSKPNKNGGWNQEAALDIEWAHAMAPAAKIVLVEAKSAFTVTCSRPWTWRPRSPTWSRSP